LNGINLGNVAALTGNAFNGIVIGTGYNSALTVGGTSIIDGSGIVQNSAFSSAVTYTNLTKVGTITTGTWNGSTISAAYGGTGTATTPTNGQLLIGNGTGYTVGSLGLTGLTQTQGAGTLALAVAYGAAANTAVQGNVQVTCASGTGNLSGGGTVITLGTGGTCGNIAISDNPTFTGTVTANTFNGQTLGTATSFTGTVAINTLGTATNATYLCYNSSKQVAACNTTGAGAAFVQGGNNFGADADLGTNGAGQNLNFRTAGVGRLQLDTSGNLYFQQSSNIDTAGSVTSGIVGIGTTNARTINLGNSNASTVVNFTAGAYGLAFTNTGANINSASSAGSDLTFGSSSNVVGRTIKVVQAAAGAGANMTIQAGSAGTGSVNGGNLVLQGGAKGTTGGSVGAVVAKANGSDGVAFQVQKSDGTVLTSQNTSTFVVSIGNGTQNFTSTGTGDLYVTGSTGVSGLVLIGTTTNGSQFDATTHELSLSGTARHAKKIFLTAEYAGATLDSNGGTSVTGTMTAGFDSTNRFSYYKWTTGQATAQSYDVVVQIPVPSDFNGWNGTTPLSIVAYTSNTGTGTITCTLTDTNGTVETGINGAGITPTAASTWQTRSCGTVAGTYVADGMMTLRVHLTSPTGGDVRIANVTMNYYSKY
jgi:hypothetical protein